MFRENTSFMTVLMLRDISNFPEQVHLFKLLSFTYMYVESHQDYLTVESKDMVSCKAFSDVKPRAIFFQQISSYAAFSAEYVRSMIKEPNCMTQCFSKADCLHAH